MLDPDEVCLLLFNSSMPLIDQMMTYVSLDRKEPKGTQRHYQARREYFLHFS